jgi:O-antigen ligase
VVLDAHYLDQTGELMLTIKKLPLLISYMSIFVIVASSVRRTEVPAFMTFTLVLAVLCALGTIYEYRFKTNVFVSWSDALLPSPFELVTDGNGLGVDSLGRRWVAGPTAYGVELVTMLSMAMAIAVVGIVSTKTRRRRLLYALAVAVLFAAMFATQRKSALLAPVAVLLTLAYFRRKELLSLAPLGLVLAVTVAAISPGAVHGVVSQFVRSDRSHVATVSDRTSDYDAIRPDLWTHLALGRGYGSYNHDTYRILDSEILSRTVETGVLGLLAFLLIPISVVLAGRRTVARRDPRWAPPALCGVASAVCFIVSSTLYDVMAFPHGTCTFLYIAGLAAVVVGAGEAEDEAVRRAREHQGRTHRTRAQLPRGAPRVRAGRAV